MVAIIFVLKEWRQYLLDAKHPFEILTDHKNLEFFKKPQDLSWRQAQWTQLLQEYHYTITHRSGKTNPADPLSCRADFENGDNNNKQQTVIPPSQIRNVETIKELVTKNQSAIKKTASKAIKEGREPWMVKDGLIHWETWMYIPDQPQLWEKVIQQSHDWRAGM
jgi:hypothetical protein